MLGGSGSDATTRRASLPPLMCGVLRSRSVGPQPRSPARPRRRGRLVARLVLGARPRGPRAPRPQDRRSKVSQGVTFEGCGSDAAPREARKQVRVLVAAEVAEVPEVEPPAPAACEEATEWRAQLHDEAQDDEGGEEPYALPRSPCCRCHRHTQPHAGSPLDWRHPHTPESERELGGLAPNTVDPASCARFPQMRHGLLVLHVQRSSEIAYDPFVSMPGHCRAKKQGIFGPSRVLCGRRDSVHPRNIRAHPR